MKWDVIFIIVIVIITIGLLVFNYWWLPKQGSKSQGEEAGKWCPVGTSANFGGSDMYEVKGIENHQIMGKSMDLCCGERTATSGAGKGKKCIDVITGDYNYLIMWVASEKTGWQYDKLFESYPKGSQRCMISFENGRDIGTLCTPK